MTPAGGDTEDPLGLDVEGEAAFPEDQLQVSFNPHLEAKNQGCGQCWGSKSESERIRTF